MRLIIGICLLLITSHSKASIGVNYGLGLPFLSQTAIDYTMGKKWSAQINYNKLSLELGEAAIDLTAPELLVSYHPFEASFFLALGLGKQSLEISASSQSLEASANIEAMTSIVKLGWMWGKEDEGFWFGMDLSYITPKKSEINIKTNGLSPNDEQYKDVEEAAEKYGNSSYINFTFARLGYIF